MIKKFLTVLAKSPFGTAIKVGVGAGCAWLLSNIATLNLNPQQSVIVIAVVTMVINALNPQDTRYGKVADNGTSD